MKDLEVALAEMKNQREQLNKKLKTEQDRKSKLEVLLVMIIKLFGR